jgi:DNA-directed RNA polymerase alpha subunit
MVYPFKKIAFDTDGLTVRTVTVLRNIGIETIDDLCAFSERDLLKHQNFGRKSLCEIREFLSGHRRCLRSERFEDLAKTLNEGEAFELVMILLKKLVLIKEARDKCPKN